MNNYVIAPEWYRPIFLHIVVILSLFQANKLSPDRLNVSVHHSEKITFWMFIVFMILFVGTRPEHVTFGDDYASAYRLSTDLDIGKDWLYSYMVYVGNLMGLDWSVFCLLCTTIYIGGTAFAVSLIFQYRSMTALAVTFAAFSFFSYCTNGIRNGLGCSMFLVALAYYREKKIIYALTFAIISIGFHNSLFIPALAFVVCYLKKNTKHYMYFWGICIILGLFVGDFMQLIYQNLGFIETGRDSSYFLDHDDMSGYALNGGFRWDFLLYSSIPIFIGYYFVKVLKFQDNYFKLILNMYIFTNSLWVLVNRNWLSNRIAFLSWFMYALVMMYPILNIEYLRNRSKWIAYTVVGNAAFSYLMWIIGKYR